MVEKEEKPTDNSNGGRARVSALATDLLRKLEARRLSRKSTPPGSKQRLQDKQNLFKDSERTLSGVEQEHGHQCLGHTKESKEKSTEQQHPSHGPPAQPSYTGRRVARTDAREALFRDCSPYLIQTPPPVVEWWDVDVPKDVNDAIIIPQTATSQLVTPHNELSKVYLTPREAKRIRKNERSLRLKESQDRIRLGLDPPPPPKLKLSNMGAAANASISSDPTSQELLVREAEKARRQVHEETNKRRKVLAVPKWEKKLFKFERDLASAPAFSAAVVIFRALDSGKDRHTIDSSARSHFLNGMGLWGPKLTFSFVAVEGVGQYVERFIKLLTRKLEGILIWTGGLRYPHFERWSTYSLTENAQAVRLLNSCSVSSYWHLAIAGVD